MVRNGSFLLGLLLIFVLSSNALGQGRFPLEFKEAGKNHLRVISSTRLYTDLSTDKPKELKTVHPDFSKEVFYSVVPPGGSGTVLALDTGSDPVKLYWDSNRDGNLADEKAFEGTEAKGRMTFTGVAIGPRNAKDGDVVKADVNAWRRSSTQAYILMTPAALRIGTVKLGDKTYRVALVDANYNGRYSDTFVPPFDYRSAGDFDFLAFDLNGNEIFERGYPTGEVFPCVKSLEVDGVTYGITVKPDGSELTMKKITPETGTLELLSKDVEIMLFSDTGRHLIHGSTKYELPTGKYQVLAVNMRQTDKDGETWLMDSRTGFGEMESFEIASGNTFKGKIGPPLTVKALVAGSRPSISINVAITGRAGEQYSAGATKNGRKEPAPTVKIYDEEGKLLDEGAFKYG